VNATEARDGAGPGGGGKRLAYEEICCCLGPMSNWRPRWQAGDESGRILRVANAREKASEEVIGGGGYVIALPRTSRISISRLYKTVVTCEILPG
jgi:hypothetical protein